MKVILLILEVTEWLLRYLARMQQNIFENNE